MGEVLRVYDKQTNAVYAAKRLLPHLVRGKDIERFRREVGVLKRLRHPNVVRLVEASDDPRDTVYVMEFCSEGSLDRRYAAKRASERDAAEILCQIAEGLNALHTAEPPVVHRDLKPGNVLLGDDGLWKLADLGLSLADGDRRVTTSNWITPGFAAPEQYSGFADVGARADLYALGAVGYWLVTGRDCRGTPDLTADRVGDNLSCLLPHLLRPSPDDRVVSLPDVIRALKHMLIKPSDEFSVYAIGTCPRCGYFTTAFNWGHAIGFETEVDCLRCDWDYYHTQMD